MEIKFTIKQVVAVGIGAALFVVIGMINIPTLFQIQASSFSMRYKRYFLLFLDDYRFACRVDWSCNQGFSCWLRFVVDLDYR